MLIHRRRYFALSLLLTGLPQAWTADYNFQVEVSSNGKYKITESFQISGRNLDSLETKLVDFKLLKQSQKNLTGGNLSEPQSIRVPSGASKASKFELVTTVTKSGFEKSMLFKCELIRYPNSLSQTCTLDLTRYDGGDLFIASSSTLTCDKHSERIKCYKSYQGQTKSQRVLWINRSAPHLAVSGAAEVLESDYRWQELLAGKKSSEVEVDLQSDSHYLNTVHSYWEPAIAAIGALASGEKLITKSENSDLKQWIE